MNSLLYMLPSLFLNLVVGSSWSEWETGKCSVTCGNGFRQRTRKCINGNQCVGPDIIHETCQEKPCDDEFERSSWSPWSPCSGSCGIGTRQRMRFCKFESKLCSRAETQIESCRDDAAFPPCPTDGGWTEWYTFLPCPFRMTVEMCREPYKHQQVQMRFCSNPRPAYGGKLCEGPEFDYTSCSQLNTFCSKGKLVFF